MPAQGIVDATKTDQITFGAETQRTSLSTGAPSAFDPNPIPTTGVTRINGYYAQYQTTLLQQLTLTGGARRDIDSEFNGHTALKVSGAWQVFSGATVFRANYGDGFKAPSLYELFSLYSNPVKNLAPESAHGWEVGVDQRILDGRARASVTYFERRTRDQIDFFSCFGVVSSACTVRPFGYYDNIDRSKAQGVELELTVQLSNRLSLTGNYTHLKAVDLVTQDALARRPRAMANLRVDWTPDSTWVLGAGASYTGSRFDDQFESVPLPDYTLVNLYAAHAITRQLRAYGRVENVLDKQYEPVAGYGALPRTVTVGLRVSL
jgi:vitamin B12 transporter